MLATPDGRVVATTDFLIEGRHFRREWSAPRDVGHKAAARSLADVAAMGAVPTALLVALAAPPGTPVSWLESFTAGLAAECARAGAAVIGGDTSRADRVVLAVTGLGDLSGRSPVLRSGARAGDVVAVAGPLGHAAAGLALLSAGRTEPAGLVAAQLRPEPPYDAGPEAAILGATAMIDVSDGLLADLGHIAAASQLRLNVRTAALKDQELFYHNGTATPVTLTQILTGGEDHSLAATFPPGTQLPSRWHAIGEARQGTGVLVDDHPYAATPGWDHFH